MTEQAYESRIFGLTTGRTHKLSGFQKNHHIPDAHHPAAQDFVRKVGNELVKSTLDGLYRDIRQLFTYKRKSMAYTCEDGYGLVKTPEFDLQIRIDQCPEDFKNYQLTVEITALHSEEIASDPRFHSCFNFHCDQLIVEPQTRIDVEAKIDAIEEIPEICDNLTYEPDGSALELTLKDLDLNIRVTETDITFSLLALRNLEKLLERSQQAFSILAAAGLEPRLP